MTDPLELADMLFDPSEHSLGCESYGDRSDCHVCKDIATALRTLQAENERLRGLLYRAKIELMKQDCQGVTARYTWITEIDEVLDNG